jgi:hypothetical protein
MAHSCIKPRGLSHHACLCDARYIAKKHSILRKSFERCHSDQHERILRVQQRCRLQCINVKKLSV